MKKLLVLLSLPLFLSGCGAWTNFTTYFNLYYDAMDSFQQAERDINLQQTELFAIQEPVASQTTTALLVKVEEKCSQILQFHAESGFVDNSLFVLGKCFYYQQNYQKALRKFEELIATQQKSSLIPETNLWIGKTQMRLKDFDKGLAALKDTRETAIKAGNKIIAQNAFIEEIKYYIFKEDYVSAIDLLKDFLTVSNNNVLNAEVSYNIGKLYAKTNDLNNAIVYYKKVKDYSPAYNIEYNSSIEQGKILRETGEYDKSLDIFYKMSREHKYIDSLMQIDFERGLTYLKMNKIDDAIELFTAVDTSKAPSAGKAAYELGKLFLFNFRNFDSAAYFFNQAVTSTAPTGYITLARSLFDQMSKYQKLYTSVLDKRKELGYALDSTLFIKDSIEYIKQLTKLKRQAMFDSLKSKNKLQRDLILKDTSLIASGNQQQNTGARDTTNSQVNPILQQNLPPQQTNNPPQQTNNPLQQTNNPLQQTNNPLQQTRLQQSGEQNQQLNPSLQQVNTGFRTSRQVELKAPVRPTAPIDTLINSLVAFEFELGNFFFSDFNMLDSAYKYYSDIMVNYPATPYEGRINFAIGSYFLSMNDSVKADSIFNFIYNKYRNESIVNAAAVKLNKPLIDYDYDPAKKLYTEAESLMVKANYDSSITNMYKIYLTHHKSPYASRALYAMGWMLENKNMNDSAAAVYDTLAQEYPRSVYAADILPKITFYKDELVRIQKAKKDSALIAFKGIKADTLLSDSTRFKLQKLAGLTSDSTKKGTSIPGGNGKETADLTNPNAEKELLLKNAVANPDTLIRVRGRGIRRQEQ